MRTGASHLFTIPPGSPFLPTLVDALFDGRLVGPLSDDPAALADITIYVPTRRATRALIALLAERGGAKAQLLPRIVPLGEADEAEFELTGLEGTPLEESASLKPPIPPLERRLILTRLIQRWSAQVDRTLLQLGPDVPFLVPGSPADAVNLAADLETLMDSFTTEGIDWHALELAVDADFSEYFRITRNFVQIVSEYWPQILAERQASDPAARRGALIEAEARRLDRVRPATPMIVAGSTGSIPATANLMAAIARLPKGAIVLPGLDTDLDEESWRKIGGVGDDDTDPTHTHPQATLRRLVDNHLRVKRSEIVVLGQATEAATARTHVLSEALRPAETTDLWSEIPTDARLSLAQAGCAGIAVVEATDEREEALAIAVALRETLNDPHRSAALVTPDRALAARVAAELARWNIAVEDSAGCALSDTPTGRLARLAAEAAAEDLRPLPVLSLLAHPLVRLGWPRETVAHAASVLEIGVLRGPTPGEGLAGMRTTLARNRSEKSRRAPRARQRLTETDWDQADALLRRLEVGLRDFFAGLPRRRHARSHRPDRAPSSRGRSAHGAAAGRCRRCARPLGRSADGAVRRSRNVGNPLGGRSAAARTVRRLSGVLHHPREAAESQSVAPLDASPRQDPRPARSAAPVGRSDRAGRARRGHMAAAHDHRRVSQPAHARPRRPCAAGAPHRPDGA